MTYGKILFLVVLCFAVATPFVMKHRNAQAAIFELKRYCDVAPVEAARDGIDCATYKKSSPAASK